jgi:hypothetical protein
MHGRREAVVVARDLVDAIRGVETVGRRGEAPEYRGLRGDHQEGR